MEQITIFSSNNLLIMNYDGSAEKFSYSISISVPSVTANIEMTPACDWITHSRLKYPDVGSISKMSDLNGIVSFSSARVNVYNIL